MKKISSFIFIFICSLNAFAQTPAQDILYEKFSSAGLNITNSGFNFNYSHGDISNVKTRKFFEIEFASIHHPKEYRQTQDKGYSQVGIPNAKPFVYGKQNAFFNLNVSYGVYKELGRKADRAGVSVGIKMSVGLSLGILKPYYLQLLYPVDKFSAELRSEKYSENNKTLFLDPNSIYGGSGFQYGIAQLKFVPGIHTKIGMHFDYAIYDEYLKAIEAGIFFNAYYKSVPIMVLKRNEQFYPGIYVGFDFGKKK